MGADWLRERCWVAVDADGTALEIYEATPHYKRESDALIAVTQYGYEADDGKVIAGVKVLPRPCVELTCDGCGEDFEDLDGGYGSHFADPSDAHDAGGVQDWTSGPDGTVHCPDCPPLTASPATVPHVPGQLALDGTEGDGPG